MTLGGWFGFGLFTFLVWAVVALICFASDCKKSWKILSAIIGAILNIAMLVGLLWYFNNTASGLRALTDQKSDLRNGLERVITIYTADGNVIAQYEGKIDIEGNDGGYVVFDYQGNRYTYYNCFVESIAKIP